MMNLNFWSKHASYPLSDLDVLFNNNNVDYILHNYTQTMNSIEKGKFAWLLNTTEIAKHLCNEFPDWFLDG